VALAVLRGKVRHRGSDIGSQLDELKAWSPTTVA
jgi:hypothetical protein